jgi:quinoprotein glucose dehydrogenase
VQTPDVEFGPDGAMYVADWVGMWDKIDKGRIWKLADPERLKNPAVLEVKKLISEGMKERPVEELSKLLGHADQRIRQAAQFELAARKESGVLANLTDRGWPQLARIHAIWGLGQLKAKDALLPLLGDADAEVRAQAAKTLGGLKTVLAYDRLVALLKDESPRVRFFAALGLGKIGKRDAMEPVLAFLRANNNEDRMLQHAGIMALTGMEDIDGILKAGQDASAAVRMAALIALRKLKRSEAERFLTDADPKIVIEAARAIYDTPIETALPALIRLLKTPKAPEWALLRAVNAAFRAGAAEDLIAFAAQPDAPEAARVEALKVLADWEHPSGRDRLMGLWRPIPERPLEEASAAFQTRMKELLRDPAEAVVVEAARLAGVCKLEAAGALLKEAFLDAKAPAASRAAALRAMAGMNQDVTTSVVAALEEKDPLLVREAVRLLPQAKLPDAGARLERIVAGEAAIEIRQAAVAALGELGADAALAGLLERGVAAGLQLDLLETSAKRPALKSKVAAFNASRKTDDPLSTYRETIEGGDPAAGRRIFFERADVQCVRCHTIGDQGGQVGPPLTQIAAQKTREYLLESLVLPNKQIAEGWGQIAVQLQNDAVEVGRVEKETDAVLTLILADGSRKTIPKGDLKARKAALSAMPEDLVKNLSKRDLRDLVAFLASLK